MGKTTNAPLAMSDAGASGEVGSARRALAMTALALIAIGLIGWVDTLSGTEFGMSLFYLVPVVACGWWVGKRSAATAAVGAAIAWVAADLFAQYPDAGWLSAWNGLTRIVIYIFVGISVAASRRDRQRMAALLELSESLARTDALTGLANTRAFMERLTSELPRLRRSAAPVCVAYLDLDNFKKVNDRYGHGAGDELLRRIGGVLRQSVRAGDVAARLGGDEFAILLWDSTARGAEETCRRIIERIDALEEDFPETGIGASAGVAHFLVPPTDVDEVIRRADDAMYAAKRAGKGRVVLAAGADVEA